MPRNISKCHTFSLNEGQKTHEVKYCAKGKLMPEVVEASRFWPALATLGVATKLPAKCYNLSLLS